MSCCLAIVGSVTGAFAGRFKGVVFSFRDALAFVFAMDKNKELCPKGLCEENVAKLDIVKLKQVLMCSWN